MQTTQQSEPVQPRNDIEQLSTNPRGHIERLFEKRTSVKQPSGISKKTNAYVSDIVNVQSLLNLQSAASRPLKRHNSTSFHDRVIINVCGDRYETHRTTLELYPDTLLGNRKRRKYYYDKTHNEYFFDRNRACFEAILYYYQSHGRLRRPAYIPIDMFLEEVTFFQLGKVALDQLRKEENIKEVRKVRLPKNRFRRHLWATMEYPEYSILAKVVNIVSLFMILLSVIALAIETLPQYENMPQIACQKEKDAFDNSLNIHLNNTNGTKEDFPNNVYVCHAYFTLPFFLIQTVCVGFFTIELFLRIISAPSLCDYIKTIMNWIDVIGILPYYFILGIRLAGRQDQAYATAYVALRFLRILRFTRIFKFYRVFKNIKSLRVLTSALKQSIPDLFIMIVLLTLLSFLFGAAAYFAEHETNGQAFDSILKATYWGVITITSVGYGDISPITPIGRIIACLCALFGAATIGMLVSVLVDRYQRVFARKLYTNEEIVDLHDYSDDENNDTDSKVSSGQVRRRNIPKEIEDPDARARNNAAFEKDDDDKSETTSINPLPSTEDVNENSMRRPNSCVHIIIGYVDDEKHATSRDLLETISSAVVHRQISGDNIQLNIISDEQQQQKRLSPHDVKFKLSLSSEEDTDDDDDEEFTEIVNGFGSKGNVLKKFQCPPSPENNKQLDKPEKHV